MVSPIFVLYVCLLYYFAILSSYCLMSVVVSFYCVFSASFYLHKIIKCQNYCLVLKSVVKLLFHSICLNGCFLAEFLAQVKILLFSYRKKFPAWCPFSRKLQIQPGNFRLLVAYVEPCDTNSSNIYLCIIGMINVFDFSV